MYRELAEKNSPSLNSFLVSALGLRLELGLDQGQGKSWIKINGTDDQGYG